MSSRPLRRLDDVCFQQYAKQFYITYIMTDLFEKYKTIINYTRINSKVEDHVARDLVFTELICIQTLFLLIVYSSMIMSFHLYYHVLVTVIALTSLESLYFNKLNYVKICKRITHFVRDH